MGNHISHLQGTFYHNVLIVGKNGEPLSTVSTRKANWYVNRKLAEDIIPPKPYPRAIQLNFTHKAKDAPEAWDLHIGNDQCVLCGDTIKLSLHHIVPHVIRRHFPDEHKKHSREWCVLLCTKCHDKVELVSQPVYKKEFPHRGRDDKSANLTVQIIKANGNIDKIPAEKLKLLLSWSDYKTVEEIPPYETVNRRDHFHELSVSHREAIKQWALKFVDDHGGIDGTKKYFLELFMTFKPKYLPTWFDELLK